MELTTKQRVILLSLVSGLRGHEVELLALRELRDKLGFPEEEHTRLEMKHDDEGNITWNPEMDAPKEIEFGEVGQHLILRQLHRLEREGELEDMHLEILHLFPWTER